MTTHEAGRKGGKLSGEARLRKGREAVLACKTARELLAVVVDLEHKAWLRRGSDVRGGSGMTQPDLFHAPTLTPRERGHLGAARAARRASATWVETATAYVLTFGQQQPGPWLTEDARAFAEAAGFSTPYDGRIWGSITQSLKRAGKIQCVGYGPAASSNASPKCTWQVVR